MKRQLILLLTGFLLVNAFKVQAQQEYQLTLYMLNPFIYNPAIAGTPSYWQIRSNHRFQWVGMTDPPITNAISAFGPHSKKDMGFGGTLLYDVTGPTSRMQLNGVYAYNISFQGVRVSMGLAAGVMQYKVDGTKIKMEDTDDPILQPSVYSKIAPDASLGIYVYGPGFFGGLSVKQLLNNTIKLANEENYGLNKLRSHFYMMGGYTYEINREWVLEPTVVIKKVVPAPYQVEISCKATFDKIFWGGLSYRTSDAVSVVLGYTYEKKIFFGYSYDVGLNDMRKYNSGSHEICIGYNFGVIRR